MQFSTIVLALAATASAAVLPREEFETPREQPHGPQGYWAVNLSNGPDGTKDAYFLTTTYYNDDVYRFPDGYTNTCVVAPNAERPINHPRGCDKTGYEWSYENRTLNISGTLPKGSLQTVSTSASNIDTGSFYLNVTSSVPR